MPPAMSARRRLRSQDVQVKRVVASTKIEQRLASRRRRAHAAASSNLGLSSRRRRRAFPVTPDPLTHSDVLLVTEADLKPEPVR